MAKLKIGIVCHPTVGGSGVIATELGENIARRGHKVHFISTSEPFRLNNVYPNLYFHEVNQSQYPLFKYQPHDIALASKIAEIIDREKLDIVHAHYAIPHAFCAVVAKQMTQGDVKIITTLHGTDITTLANDKAMLGAIQFSLNNSDLVTTVSNALRKDTIELTNFKGPIETIYNFVDEDYFKRSVDNKLRQELGIGEEEKLIIHVSNFRKVKRIADHIKVFAKINQEIKSRLILVGDGPEINRAHQLVKELNLEEDVLFLGKQINLPKLYSLSHLKLLLSEQESFGLVLAEAMACSLPCIGTRVGGIPEVINDKETGFICELGDLNNIAAKALELLRNKNLHAKFSKKSRKSVIERFSREMIIDRYEELYIKIIRR